MIDKDNNCLPSLSRRRVKRLSRRMRSAFLVPRSVLKSWRHGGRGGGDASREVTAPNMSHCRLITEGLDEFSIVLHNSGKRMAYTM